MGRSAVHEQVDHPVGLGPKMRQVRLALLPWRIPAQKRGQGGGTDSRSAAAEEVPASLQCILLAERIHIVHLFRERLIKVEDQGADACVGGVLDGIELRIGAGVAHVQQLAGFIGFL